MAGNSQLTRCPWCGTDPLYRTYHDEEWGTPQHDDTRLFEMLLLEGAQAGLSWLTILRKRKNYRSAFNGFDIDTIAGWSDVEKARLLADAGIVRNRLKIDAALRNARAAQQIRAEHGSLDAYFWSFVGGRPQINRYSRLDQIPASTPLSDRLSKSLKGYGCNFVGSTICYAFMQAVGMVNDHLVDCYRHPDNRTKIT